MKLVFQQKVSEKESKLKQSEEELYARHREMKDALEKQRAELEDKRRRVEQGRPLTPEKSSVGPPPPSFLRPSDALLAFACVADHSFPPPPSLPRRLRAPPRQTNKKRFGLGK